MIDTDGDGLPDGWEVAHGMDPLVDNTGDPRADASADPDLDGLTNAEEAALGTNPFQPDTDTPLRQFLRQRSFAVTDGRVALTLEKVFRLGTTTPIASRAFRSPPRHRRSS